MPASVFPAFPINDTIVIAETIFKQNAGQPMRRLTIFDVLRRSPSSSTSRQLVTASSGYGLTQGGYNAELISLTERGKSIVDRNDPKSRIEAILDIDIFRAFFEKYRNSILPSPSAAADFLKGHGVPEGSVENCFEILIKNGEQVGLIQEISGTKRVVSIDHALENLSKGGGADGVALTDGSNKHSPESGSSTNLRDSEIKENYFPSIHIDVQIHISSEAKAEQIDQIFASMNKHLFMRNRSENA